MFTDAFGRAMLHLAAGDRRVAAITAAMEKGTGLYPFKAAFPDRFFDVGIAEEHAVTFAAGLAAQGLRPVAAIYSTFIQRAMDQVIHDTALQKLPVIFAMDRSGFVGDDGETHQGLFDIALFRPIPRMTILAPAGEGELSAMLGWALGASGPVMIRYPKAPCPPEVPAFALPLEPGRGVFVRQGLGKRDGPPVCVAFTGGLYREALAAAEELAPSFRLDLYNLRFLKPLDEDYFAGLLEGYRIVVIAEEGIRAGGFGEYALGLARRRGCGARLACLAVDEGYAALGKRDELLRENGLDGAGIASAVRAAAGPGAA
jgi:1-deoxy-D-xylulose-5-phosphate synthase